ncbi:MAG: S-layer homology domain-containing protein [Clostridia bacterium]|nr:S-layer homology domain-containing protein [Clostridia bacterium]
MMKKTTKWISFITVVIMLLSMISTSVLAETDEEIYSSACELLSIENATLEGGVYYAETDKTYFYVSAITSPFASYELYADAACEEWIETDPCVMLTQAQTEVWLQVWAEDMETYSEPIKLVINTTATDFVTQEEIPAYMTMGNDGILAVTGGMVFAEVPDQDMTMVVGGVEEDAKQIYFKVQGMNGYEVKLYADIDLTVPVDTEMLMTADSSVNILYAVATKGVSEKVYAVTIAVPKLYIYTDTQTEWAQEYVEAIGLLGFMKGDENGAFNGENNLTRNEMAALMVRLTGANKEFFSDLEYTFMDDVPEWAEDYVKAASQMNLINGVPVLENNEVIGYNFEGARNATRSEFLKVFCNVQLTGTGMDVNSFYEANQLIIDLLVDPDGFADFDEVSEWALPTIYTSIAMGLIEGNEFGYINPNDTITRNEVATIVCRAMIEEEE